MIYLISKLNPCASSLMSLILFNGPITEKGTIPLQESRPIIEDHGCLRWLALIEL